MKEGKREKKPTAFFSLETAIPDRGLFEERMKALDDQAREIEENYQSEVKKIEENFGLFALENQKTYQRYEGDFRQVLEIIDQEYAGLFQNLDEDFLAHRDQLEAKKKQENEAFSQILADFEDLKRAALETYQSMCRDSEAAINKEFEIHQKFVDQKKAEFEAVRQNYSLMNNQQYDLLLWTMEKTKNSLQEMTQQLNEKAFSDTKFMNATILQIIEKLRDTKNKMTALFKTTTLGYANKKNRISELSEIRQIPYSEINQNLIDQYVRQISALNQKKLAFDKLVQEDYLKSSMIIGRKIIEADSQNDSRLTRKYIMQYGIVQSKSRYLLNRNQKLTDLLISKYQNEISKIKIDSFRRVEEIKLAYSMPAQYFQNAINLYSNFAFYVSESMDEIDNMLSDFIHFNQTITQTFVDYMKSSAKTFEDYKINCLVTLNNVTNKLTDMITQIDRFSHDIVALESNNRLEIASVKKAMENADITGDYQKYLAQLETEMAIAEHQHGFLLKKHQLTSDVEAALLVAQREVTEKNKQKAIEEALAKHERLINNLEKDIHDQAYDRELALIQAKYRRDLALVALEKKRALEQETFEAIRQRSLLGEVIRRELGQYEANKAAGSEFVVEYVHHAQHLIDFHKDQTLRTQDYLLRSRAPRAYAYLLEEQRRRLIHQLRFRTDQQTETHRHAIEYFDHALYTARKNIENQMGKPLTAVKRLLVSLNEENAPLQAEALSLEHFYRYEILSVIAATKDTVSALVSREKSSALWEKAMDWLDDDFREVAILTTEAEKNSLMNVKSAKGLKKTLMSFYVETILLVQKFLGHVVSALDELEEILISGDVMSIQKIHRESLTKERIIHEEFDQEIARAARQKTPAEQSVPQVAFAAKEVEQTIADRVFLLNQTFERELREQEAALRFMDKELCREDAKNRAETESRAREARAIALRTKKQVENAYRRRIEGYESLKKKSSAENLEANAALLSDLAHNDKKRAESLSVLHQSVQSVPAQNEKKLAALETEKAQFVAQRRSALEKELARLEEEKFISRPAFLAKMAEIRERLPQDYVALYQKIGEAQSTYLKQWQIVNTAFASEFDRFVKSRLESSGILFNDALVLHPFEKVLIINDRIKIKTDEVLQDTAAKSGATAEALRKQVSESEENQRRILNA
jgi:hypothetical protein